MVDKKLYKVYLAKLKRLEPKPTCVYKVGITKSYDAMDRLLYCEADEKHPISTYFTDIKIMKSIFGFTKDQALVIERKIMDTIKGSERAFHNWYEKDQISGITEMRIWNYEEVQKVISIMDALKIK